MWVLPFCQVGSRCIGDDGVILSREGAYFLACSIGSRFGEVYEHPKCFVDRLLAWKRFRYIGSEYNNVGSLPTTFSVLAADYAGHFGDNVFFTQFNDAPGFIWFLHSNTSRGITIPIILTDLFVSEVTDLA
jgi:hypothetical protein